MTFSKKVSLSEVNQSVDTPNNNRFWQNLKAFLGPGALVAVCQLFHGVVEGHAAAEKCTDFTGSSTEDGNIEVAGAVDDIFFTAAH